MPSNIAQTADGTYMAVYAKQPAWHGFGTVIPRNMKAKEAVKLAHLDYAVQKVAAYAKIGGRFVEAPDHVALVRADTKQIFGFATPEYKQHDNLPTVQFMEAIAHAGRTPSIGSLYAIGNGAKVACSLDLSALGKYRVKGDPSAMQPWMIGTWSHDATEAIRIANYMYRIECANMRAAFLASTEHRSDVVRIIHTGNLKEKLNEAQRILGFAETALARHIALMNALQEFAAPMPNTVKGKAWWDTFLDELGYKLVKADGSEMDRPGHREEARAEILDLFLNSKTLGGVKMTGYRILQAVDEYADHYKPLRVVDPNLAPERAFRSIMDGGAAAQLKDRALDLLCTSFKIEPEKVLVAAH